MKFRNGKLLSKIKVYIDAKEPCNIFPKKYHLIDKLFLDAIEKTCNKTDNPPKPSKKAHIIILYEIFLLTTEAIRLLPVVNSIIPDKNGFEYLDEKLIISKKLIWFNIEIIIENIIINPPITNNVEMEDKILEDNNSPQFLFDFL